MLKNNVALGGDINIIKTKVNGLFLAYYLKNRKKHEIASLAQGVSVVHLYSSQLKSLILNLPNSTEQQKIADFLTAVDNKIQQLTRKKALLEKYKKGISQQIFNQQLRFKDDEGNDFPDWEEKKLGEVAYKSSSNISANSLDNNNGNYIIYGAAGEYKRIDFFREKSSYISIVKDGAGVGRLLLCQPQTSVLGTIDILKPINGVDLYFLSSVLGEIDFTQYKTGSTIPHIYFKDYSKELVPVPCISEQVKIAQFLSSIDNKISFINHQLQHTQTFKKGLLQQMFI